MKWIQNDDVKGFRDIVAAAEIFSLFLTHLRHENRKYIEDNFSHSWGKMSYCVISLVARRKEGDTWIRLMWIFENNSFNLVLYSFCA